MQFGETKWNTISLIHAQLHAASIYKSAGIYNNTNTYMQSCTIIYICLICLFWWYAYYYQKHTQRLIIIVHIIGSVAVAPYITTIYVKNSLHKLPCAPKSIDCSHKPCHTTDHDKNNFVL